MGGAYAQVSQGWKMPWGLWGVELRLKGTEGAWACPQPWPQGVGNLTWEPSRHPGLELVGQMPPSYAPRTHVAWRGIRSRDTGLGAQQASRAQVGLTNALCSSPAPSRGPPPPASPDLPGLMGTDPVWLPLILPLQSPHVLPVHLGVPPVSLGVRVPHQQPVGTLIVGRH